MHGSPGKCWLTLQARLVCGLTDQPVTMTGLPLQALRFVVSRAPRSPGSPGHPEPTREGCSLTSLLLCSARKSQDRRALFFPDLRTLKEGRSNSYKARERVLLRRLPLHCLPFFSTELFVAHPLSSPPPPPAAAGSLPCVQSSLRSRLRSRAIF